MKNKDLAQLLRAAEKAGCSIGRAGSGHVVVVTPRGDRVYTSSSNPRGRGVANFRSRLRRAGVQV